MMKYINRLGADLYFKLTKKAALTRIITISEYFDRLSCLNIMLEKGSEIEKQTNKIINSELELEGYIMPKNSPFDNEIRKEDLSKKTIPNSKVANPIIPFLTKKGKRTKWNIHKGDHDPYPSVPHGHHPQSDKIKLDTYRGYVFDFANSKSEYEYRESKDFIIDLWNDENFRKFAKNSLTWYCDTYPKFNWGHRGITNPCLLPRKRNIRK